MSLLAARLQAATFPLAENEKAPTGRIPIGAWTQSAVCVYILFMAQLLDCVPFFSIGISIHAPGRHLAPEAVPLRALCTGLRSLGASERRLMELLFGSTTSLGLHGMLS